MSHNHRHRNSSNEVRIAILEHDMRSITETLKEIKQEIREFRNEMNDFRKEIIGEMNSLRKEVTGEMNDFKSEINSRINSELKWVGTRSWVQFGFTFSMIVGVLAVMAHGFKWY